ncbi:MAG: dihydrofolate reductase [Proteobacteria bacterium]|nr:dihydrofolate reductase [Pseudomonadota bacterium]
MDNAQTTIAKPCNVARISLIAALDRHRAIGRGNALPWHLPDDLKRFKALTLGKPVLMGRKTAQSLGRALPKRRNLVLSRSGQAPFAGMEAVASLDEALRLVGDEELMVIGGGEVFVLTLPLATRMHLTFVDTVVESADAFFPTFDASRWRVTACEQHPADAKHAFAFEFVDYRRNDGNDVT